MTQMYSTNDPLFFLHHAMVDKLWWRWQTQCSLFTNLYDGSNVSPNDDLVPFKTSVSQTLSTTANGFCYTYGPSDGDIPLKLQCAGGGPVNSTSTVSLNDWFMGSISKLIPAVANSSNVTPRSPLKLHARDLKLTMNGQSISIPANLPTYIPNGTILTPALDDMCDKVHIRISDLTTGHPPFITQSWIQMNNMDPLEVRKFEVKIRHQVDEYNRKEGYVSPAALQNWGKYNFLNVLEAVCDSDGQSDGALAK
jgi:Common central domain of tyrosinase